jgi:DNA repair exonuclease SbcCD ATPase subunit
MAISSIHIEEGKAGFFAHNSREQKTVNAIFTDEENFVSCDKKTAFEIYRNELEIRSAAYTKRTNQKLQSKTKTHLSAIVNLNAEHTQEDLIKVCNYLEQTFDTKIIQYAIHRDEGHIADDGTQKKNYHAHIEFMGLDSLGGAITQKLKKKQLSELQTQVAELLQMDRGVNYAQSRTKRPKRLNTYEFKKAKEMEQEQRLSQLAKVKDLKELVNNLKAELKENNATKQDYDEVRELTTRLTTRIKEKDLTIEELQKELKELQSRVIHTYSDGKTTESYKDIAIRLSKEKKELKNELLEARETIKKQKEYIESLEDDLSVLRANMEVLEAKNRSYFGLNQELKEEISKLREKITEAESRETKNNEEYIELLKYELRTTRAELSSLQDRTHFEGQYEEYIESLEMRNRELEAELEKTKTNTPKQRSEQKEYAVKLGVQGEWQIIDQNELNTMLDDGFSPQISTDENLIAKIKKHNENKIDDFLAEFSQSRYPQMKM